MLQHTGINKGLYVQHVLQVPVTLPVIKNLKMLQFQITTVNQYSPHCCNNNIYWWASYVI